MNNIVKNCKIHGKTKHRMQSDNSTYRCVKCNSESVKRWKRKIKIMSVQYKGGCCEMCGYNKCMSGLSFHHKDPNEKDFGISSRGTRSWNRTKKELDKCTLLCNNCHAEIHEALFEQNNPKLHKRLSDFISKKEPKFCKCGQKISSKSKTCNNCRIRETKINWPSVSELKSMVKKSSYVGVGKILGVSDNAIRKRIRNHS
jgi:hypothetical protein